MIKDMVIVVDNQSSPLNWRLGCFVALMTGTDGTVRVVRILTQHSELIQP